MITDQQMAQLMGPATQLIWAVRERNSEDIADCVAGARSIVSDPTQAVIALAVLLAAMVPDDRTPTECLAWLQDADRYLRLRAAGVGADAAMIAVSRSAGGAW